MDSPKIFLCILYLLLYSSFSTSDLSSDVVTQVDKTFTLATEALTKLDNLADVLKKDGVVENVERVLKVFTSLSKVAASFSFIGALLGFIFAFIPQSNPDLERIKEQLEEVNRKLDSISSRISSLQNQVEWANYASVYGKDENNIRNSWAKMKELLESAPLAKTKEDKTRMVERFTTFYENTGTENSVANFYRYLTDKREVSLNRNLLELVIKKSKGDLKIVVQYTSYFASLMITGLQLNLYYYSLKGYDPARKAEEAVTQLSDVQSAIVDSMIICVNQFEKWASEDVENIITEEFKDGSLKKLVWDIKEHLDQKFSWLEWTVIAHKSNTGHEKTFGYAITKHPRDKATIHIFHRQKGSAISDNVKKNILGRWERRHVRESCAVLMYKWPDVFEPEIMKHVQYMTAFKGGLQKDFILTYDKGTLELFCPDFIASPWTIVFLKAKDIVESKSCTEKCNNGECMQIKDTTRGFCKCHKMFYGSSCQQSVQDTIDYETIQDQINSMFYQPAPDMTKIYFSIQDMKKYTNELIGSVRSDIQWTQLFVKYSEMIEKFRYFAKLLSSLENETITEDHFVTEFKGLLKDKATFNFMLHQFDNMMQGKGFGDEMGVVGILRHSLIQQKIECTEVYKDKIDYLVHYMFALEKQAALAWIKYSQITKSEGIKYAEQALSKAVTQQWRHFNGYGCGELKAQNLFNSYCEKPYHSRDQQQIKIKCSNNYLAYPETVQCSKGKWSDLPVCYTEVITRGDTQCKSEKGTIVCSATCHKGWAFPDGTTTKTYQCAKMPCQSFTSPRACTKCIHNQGCKDSEVCVNGQCVDGCSVYTCGVNAKCSTENHIQKCTCVSPWTAWNNGNPLHGCRYKELQWVSSNGVPHNTVRSRTGYYVCRTRGPKGDWQGGWIYEHRGKHYCNFDYSWKEWRGDVYQALVDPCGGTGVEWKWRGFHSNTVEVGESADFPGVTYYVCSCSTNGVPGKMFYTRSGLLCHTGFKNRGFRVNEYYSLVKRPCF